MNLVVLPSLMVVSVSVGILIALLVSNRGSTGLFNAVLALGALGLCKFLGFLSFFEGSSLLYLVKIYYAAAMFALAVVLAYAYELTEAASKRVRNGFYSVAVLLALLTLLSPYIIAGSERMSYMAVAEKGPLYGAFRLYSLCTLLMIFFVLFNGWRAHDVEQVRKKAGLALLGLSPVLVICVVLLGMIAMGVKISATVVTPMTYVFFMLTMLYAELRAQKGQGVSLISAAPEDVSASQKVMDVFTNYSANDIDYRDAINQIERLMVMHKYEKNQRNASATAQQMGMPRSSLYSIFNRLEIETKSDTTSS